MVEYCVRHKDGGETEHNEWERRQDDHRQGEDACTETWTLGQQSQMKGKDRKEAETKHRYASDSATGATRVIFTPAIDFS